jgi:hypothetical protein
VETGIANFLRIQALVLGLILLISCVSKGQEKSGASQAAVVSKGAADVVQLEIKANFDFFGERPGEWSKQAVSTKVSIPVGGSAELSGLEREITINDGPKKQTKNKLFVYLESINNGVVFTEFRLQRLPDGAATESVKLKIAAPIDTTETSSFSFTNGGRPGAVKGCTVSMKPSFGTQAPVKSE